MLLNHLGVPSWDPDPPRISHPTMDGAYRIQGIDGFSDSFCISLCRYSSASDAILIFDASDGLWSLPMRQARAQDALTRGQGTKGNGTIGMAPLRSVFGDLGRGWELSFDRLSWNELIYNDASDKNYHLELLHLLIQLSNRSMLILF